MRRASEASLRTHPIAACDAADRALWTSVVAAFARQSSWREGLRAAAYAAARFAEERPAEIRSIGAVLARSDAEALRMRSRIIRRYAGLIDAGRLELPDPEAVGRVAAECALGAVVESLLARLPAGELSGAQTAVPAFMFLAVLPYVGEAAAREELRIPPPP